MNGSAAYNADSGTLTATTSSKVALVALQALENRFDEKFNTQAEKLEQQGQRIREQGIIIRDLQALAVRGAHVVFRVLGDDWRVFYWKTAACKPFVSWDYANSHWAEYLGSATAEEVWLCQMFAVQHMPGYH